MLRVGLLVALAACNPHVRRDAGDLPIQIPDRYASKAAGSSVAASERWWTAFGDPALDMLEARLLAENLDLRQARERIIQARAIATHAGSARWPQLNASLSSGASRVHVPEVSVGPGGVSTSIEPDVVQSHGISLEAAYEVDVWGRVEALADAADADVTASELDRQAIAVSLTAALAEAWFALVETRARLALLERQVALNQTLLELVELRFENGLAGAVDVLQQRELLARVQSGQPLVVGRAEALEHQIATLLAQPPGALNLPETNALPALPATPDTGVPADLLRRRPDIRAAQARLAAADHRVAAAVADRFPAIRLTARTGFQADDLGDLLDRWVWSLLGSVVAPLIDGGRRAAEVERRKAALREGVHRLAAQLLTALREVSDALTLEGRQREHLQRLDRQLTAGRELFQQAQARYVEGLSDYLPVLNALRGVQQTELDHVAASRVLLSYRVQLHRALGGDLVPPTSRSAAPKESAPVARGSNEQRRTP